MAKENRSHPRRSFLKSAAGTLGLGFWADETLDALPQNTNTNSKPSDLKITDMRALTVRGAPLIGEDNEEIYCGELGMKKAEVEKLKQEGAI